MYSIVQINRDNLFFYLFLLRINIEQINIKFKRNICCILLKIILYYSVFRNKFWRNNNQTLKKKSSFEEVKNVIDFKVKS